MARKRNGASPAKPPRGTSRVFHLFAGVLLGLLLAFLLFLHGQRDNNGEYNFDSIKKQVDQSRTAEPPAQPHRPQIYFPVPEKPRYGFYEDLKEQEVNVPSYNSEKPIESQPLLLPEATESSQPANGNTLFVLQAGSFRNAEDAERLKARLALLGLQSHIELVEVPDGYWHRVRLGPFGSLPAANKVRTLLHSNDINTLMVTSKTDVAPSR